MGQLREFRNSSKEVLPRRERGELKVDEGCLDISGVFARQGYDRSQLAIELPYKDFSSLRILDVRRQEWAHWVVHPILASLNYIDYYAHEPTWMIDIQRY